MLKSDNTDEYKHPSFRRLWPQDVNFKFARAERSCLKSLLGNTSQQFLPINRTVLDEVVGRDEASQKFRFQNPTTAF